MVERAALEMRYTHYVVSGVRIPHSPQQEKGRFVCLSLLKQANRSFFFEQGASGSLLGLRRNPSLSAKKNGGIPPFFLRMSEKSSNFAAEDIKAILKEVYEKKSICYLGGIDVYRLQPQSRTDL